jgi:hypothetical protein
MYIVTSIIVIVFTIAAAAVFGYGLRQLRTENPKARSTMSTGFIIGLIGVVIAAITYGGFSI